MSLKIGACIIALSAAIATLSPTLSAAQTMSMRVPTQTVSLNCRVVGAISHRCYSFHSDAAWREGLADYHGSNGG
jgi:hypothetical protein